MFDRRRFLEGTVVASGGAAMFGGAAFVQAAGSLPLSGPAPQPAPDDLSTSPVVEGPFHNPYAGAATMRWWRGQLHTHTARSYDGDPSIPPYKRAHDYLDAGFDFTVFTDHNRVSALPAGGILDTDDGRSHLTFAGTESTFPTGHLGVWFIGEVAAGATAEPSPVPAHWTPDRRIEAWAGLGALVCCNHPSHSSAPLAPEQVARWAGGGVPFRFMEVFNTLANATARATSHNLEAWRRAIDAAGPSRPIWGVASDDSHRRAVGKSWIAVAAPWIDAAALRAALLAGRFYASNGPAFSFLGVHPDGDALAAVAPGAEVIRFIGNDGEVRATVPTRAEESVTIARYEPRPGDRWIRIEAEDAEGGVAWSQPFWLD